jgi:DNA-binding NarL/FixJ family response regulator
MGIRILLADDHKLLREACALPEEQRNMTVAAEAEDGGPRWLAAELSPDIIVMDI